MDTRVFVLCVKMYGLVYKRSLFRIPVGFRYKFSVESGRTVTTTNL